MAVNTGAIRTSRMGNTRNRSAEAGRSRVYVEGNTVRRQREQFAAENIKPVKVSEATRMNRERSLQMNVSYVLFLTVAAVITVMICVNYLRLQAQYTELRTAATRLETSLSSAKLANDAEYDRIMASVNLENVKNTAMEKLGMVYASEDQIVTYEAPVSDYVKQYQEIPD